MWSRKCEAQREKQKTKPSDNDRGRDSLRQDRQFAAGPAEKRRCHKKQVDRHVGQNEKWDEWNAAFPFEIKRSDVRTLRRDPVASAVDDQEQDRQAARYRERFAPFNGHVERLRP